MHGVRLLLVALSAGALLGAALVQVLLRIVGRRTGFQFSANGEARIIASDVGVGIRQVLRDEHLGICGKPDYLLETPIGGELCLVPLEVKPSRRSQRLYDSDRIQIGAYLVALRATVAERASRIGYVRYQSRTFEVPLTLALEGDVARIAAAVRHGRTVPVVHRSHNIPARCRACPVRQHCDEALLT